jgi:glycine/D-amino acid oxidase-like deaminating enzyme
MAERDRENRPAMHVLICGGGVIGASIAYFLSRRGIRTTIVERAGIACAASGKSGGFLARDWCDGTPLQELARRSFDLHTDLAGRLGGDWGYRRLHTYGGFAPLRQRRPPALAWLSQRVVVGNQLGSPITTAQVHPARFTGALMHAAESHGAALRIGCVTGLVTGNGRVAGVAVDGETITLGAGDAVVIALGPWSLLASQWLPLPAVYGLKGHSLVFETGDAIPAEAAFLEYREHSGEELGPELFPRPDGTTYVCALSSESPLPRDPADVAPDPGAVERLHALCADISPVLAAARVIAAQACFRPITSDGLPLIGRAPGVENAYVATGHGVWGILNAPATGEAMAELIAEGQARSVDLLLFDPARLPPLEPRHPRG